MQRIVQVSGRVVLVSGLFLMLTGCPPKNNSQPSYDRGYHSTAPVDHVVQYPGETLSIIAGWYTGNQRNWQLLQQANPGLNPNRIRLGDVIRIPGELVIRQDAMPRSALSGGGSSSSARRDTSSKGEETSVGSSGSSSSVSSAASVESENDVEESASSISERAVEEWDNSSSADTNSVSSEAAEVQSESSASSVASSGDRKEMRIKSRDELLKELLEE